MAVHPGLAYLDYSQHLHYHNLRRSSPHLLHLLLARGDLAHGAATFTRPRRLIFLEVVHSVLDLRTQICAMEALLMDLLTTALAVPSQAVYTALWSRLLDHNAYAILEAHWIVWNIAWEQKQLTLVDVDISELAVLYSLQ